MNIKTHNLSKNITKHYKNGAPVASHSKCNGAKPHVPISWQLTGVPDQFFTKPYVSQYGNNNTKVNMVILWRLYIVE